MSTSVKRILIAAGVVVVILLAVPFFVNADRFRPVLERTLATQLNRNVTIGKLSLSIFKGAVQADQIVISDDPAFSKEPFITATGLKIGVELLPLITRQKLMVDEIGLSQPSVHLIQNSQMNWNYATLGGAKADPPPTTAGLQGEGIDLHVKKVALRDGIVSVKLAGGAPQGITIQKLDADLSDLSSTSEMPLSVSGNVQPGGAITLKGKFGPLNSADVARTPLNLEVTLQNLDLGKSGIVAASTAIHGIASAQTSLASRDGVAVASGRMKIENLQVGANSRPAGQPVEMTYRLDHNIAAHEGTIRQGVAQVSKASLHYQGDYKLQPQQTLFNASVNGEAMPVDDLVALLPAFGVVLPQGATLRGGTMTLSAKSGGTTSAPVTNGKINLVNSTMTGYSMGAAITEAAALAGIKVGKDTVIQSLDTAFDNSPRGSQLTGIQLVVQDLGTLTGSIALDSADNLSGKLNAHVHSSGGLLGAGLKQAGGSGESDIDIPLTLSGTASNPKIAAQAQAIAKQAATAAASSALEKYAPGSASALGGLFGKKKKK